MMSHLIKIYAVCKFSYFRSGTQIVNPVNATGEVRFSVIGKYWGGSGGKMLSPFSSHETIVSTEKRLTFFR